jgi:S-formylglutathione hydrolase
MPRIPQNKHDFRRRKEEMRMKILKCAILLIALPFHGHGQPATGERLLKLTMPAPALAGGVLDAPTEQPLIVCLPPSYHKTRTRYPVIYFLPGFTTDVTEMIDGTFQGLHVGTAIDGLVAAGKIREMIFVVANGRNFLGGSFYVNSPATGNWEDFIVKDVVRYVDKKFRTRALASCRGIAGSSMGGFGAIHLAMRHPDVFGAAYSLSPGLFAEDGLKDQGMFESEPNIIRYLEKQAEFDAMPAAEVKKTFRDFVAELYDRRTLTDYFWAFSYAYGAAFSANSKRGAPYIDYPYTLTDGRPRLDPEILKKYEGGFGALPEKLDRYRKNLRKLRGIVIDIGANDRYGWIVQGSRYFARLLSERNIPHQLLEHDGGHEDRLRERFEGHLLPFFSKNLSMK